MGSNLTTEKFWEKFWGINESVNNEENKGSKEIRDNIFSKLFKQYLPRNDLNKVALEIGCVPGSFLAYICENFDYFPEGIDYVKNAETITSRVLKNNGLNDFKIHQKDFLKWKPNKKYDLVCSFGFIEHFKNPERIVKRHVDLMKENGKLIIEIPNMAGFKGWLHKIVDQENLEKHNTNIMNLKFFKQVVKENNLKICYLNYYGGFDFQWLNYNSTFFQKIFYAGLKLISKVTKHIDLKNKLSTYIILIAEKSK